MTLSNYSWHKLPVNRVTLCLLPLMTGLYVSINLESAAQLCRYSVAESSLSSPRTDAISASPGPDYTRYKLRVLSASKCSDTQRAMPPACLHARRPPTHGYTVANRRRPPSVPVHALQCRPIGLYYTWNRGVSDHGPPHQRNSTHCVRHPRVLSFAASAVRGMLFLHR